MSNETTIFEGDEKFIIIVKAGKKTEGARVTRAIQRDTLATKQIVAWLNGHQIIDTGVCQKIDGLDYRLLDVSVADNKWKCLLALDGHELKLINHLLADEEKEYLCSCNKFRYFGKADAVIMFVTHVQTMKAELKTNGVLHHV